MLIRKLSVVIALTALAVPLMEGESAHAATGSASPTQTETVGAAQVLGTTHSVSNATQAEKAEAGDYLRRQARMGRMVDSSLLHIATGTDPLTRRGVSTVWEGGYEPREFKVVKASDGTDAAESLGVAYAENVDTTSNAVGAGGGFGFENVVSASGMYKFSNNCASTKWTAAYSSSSVHILNSCYEKWALPGSNKWVYNRYALFTMAPGNAVSWPEVTDFTTRSRPWKGKESLVTGVNGWIPKAGGTSCSNLANLKIAAGKGEVTVPIHQCENLVVKLDTTKHSMGLQWTGMSADQRYSDWALSFDASSNSAVPVFADYSWATVNWCSAGVVCTHNQNLLAKDAGWYWP